MQLFPFSFRFLVTKSILSKLETPNFKRKPLEIMNHGSVSVVRAMIMGKYGMLKCRANFSMGLGQKNCETCGTVDDESHRINDCVLYRDINLYDKSEKVNFEDIYCDNMLTALKVVEHIMRMWDLGCGKNAIRKAKK